MSLVGIGASIITQSTTRILITAGPSSQNITGTARGISSFYGVFSRAAAFRYQTYDPTCPGSGAEIYYVTPSSGPGSGGNTVTVVGNNLGNGTDVTSVSFQNIAATILSQNRTVVVVRVNPLYNGVTSVITDSICGGTAILTSAYTYILGMTRVSCRVSAVCRLRCTSPEGVLCDPERRL